MKIIIVFGTRPEAIKMAPVVERLRAAGLHDVRVCVTAQHREMLDAVLHAFNLFPDFDLDIMRSGQDLTDITTRVLTGLRGVLRGERPDLVMVHGDTTTTLAAGLAAFYERIPVAHVEAGLRTGDVYSPWPEEVNRRMVSVVTSAHFAPTVEARENLLREGIQAGCIYVTGNTVIDALLMMTKKLDDDPYLRKRLSDKYDFIDPSKKVLLVTGHRRENFGKGFRDICAALAAISERQDTQIVYPVHLNPQVKDVVVNTLGGRSRVVLLDPLDYIDFVYMLTRCHLVLTDSGGIQEEAPALGKPVLVMRNTTERPEAIAAGTAKLVGTSTDAIISGVNELLDDPNLYAKMAQARNPYGDGTASKKIAAILESTWDNASRGVVAVIKDVASAD